MLRFTATEVKRAQLRALCPSSSISTVLSSASRSVSPSLHQTGDQASVTAALLQSAVQVHPLQLLCFLSAAGLEDEVRSTERPEYLYLLYLLFYESYFNNNCCIIGAEK